MASAGVSVLSLPSIRNYLLFPWAILAMIACLTLWPFHMLSPSLARDLTAFWLLLCIFENLWMLIILRGFLRRRARLPKHGLQVRAEILEVQHEFAVAKRVLSRSLLADVAAVFSPVGKHRFPLRIHAVTARNAQVPLIHVRRKEDERWEDFRTRAVLTLEDSPVVVSGTRVTLYYQFRLPDGRSHGGLTAPIAKRDLSEMLRYGHLEILYDPKRPERSIPQDPQLRLRF